MMEKPWIDQSLCTGCGICIPLCPRSAISLKPVAEVQ
jgi:ferredoxin